MIGPIALVNSRVRCSTSLSLSSRGSIPGWKNLGTGGGLDILNKRKKIIAEIKNKHNTTKGNHKIEIYDAIKAKLKLVEYSGYTGYLVEIIPKGKKKYDKPFDQPVIFTVSISFKSSTSQMICGKTLSKMN